MDKTELVKKAVAGDEKAAGTIYKVYLPLMKGVCRKIVQDDESVVCDLVHDSYILALLSLDKLQDPERLGEWLTTIVRNVALKYISEQKRLRVVPFSSLGEDGLDMIDERVSSDTEMMEKELLELVSQLPEGYHDVFRLAVIKGFSHQEIAKLLHIKPHSSSSQLSRAKALLRKMLFLWFVLCLLIPVAYMFFIGKERYAVKRIKTVAREVGDETGEGEYPCIPLVTSSKDEQIAESLLKSDSKDSLKDSLDGMVKNIPFSENSISSVICREDRYMVDSVHIPSIVEAKRLSRRLKMKLPKWHFWAFGYSESGNSSLASGGLANLGNQVGSVSPMSFHTWEEYAQYLERQVWDGMSEDSLTLVNIAKANNGEIVEVEHHSRPITCGFSLSKKLSRSWAVNWGVQYTLLKSDFKLGTLKGIQESDSCYIKRKQDIHYLGIPFNLSYRFFSHHSFSADASVGGALHIPVSGRLKEQYVIEPNYSKTVNVYRFIPKVQWSIGLSIGVQYRLSSCWEVYMEPTFKWYIPNQSSYHTVWTDHPYMFTVPFGVRFTW